MVPICPPHVYILFYFRLSTVLLRSLLFLFTTSFNSPSVKSSGRSGASSLSEGENAGAALKPETRISGGERPRKRENKIKRQEIYI